MMPLMDAADAFSAIHARLGRPELLVLSGPSGAGKTSLIEAFCRRRDDWVESVSATTRSPRAGEVDGRDYHFVDEATFDRMIADDELLEHAQVFGRHRYGTPRAWIDARFAEGCSVIMDVDVQGAAQIRARCQAARLVFVIPPDADTLRRRLSGRGTEEEGVVQRRLAEATRELAHWPEYDYLLVNDDLGRAVAGLLAIADACARLVAPAP